MKVPRDIWFWTGRDSMHCVCSRAGVFLNIDTRAWGHIYRKLHSAMLATCHMLTIVPHVITFVFSTRYSVGIGCALRFWFGVEAVSACMGGPGTPVGYKTPVKVQTGDAMSV